jgi:hypothetical protein
MSGAGGFNAYFCYRDVNVNTYFYSANTTAFSAFKDDYINGIGWPDDAIEVTEQVYSEFRVSHQGQKE